MNNHMKKYFARNGNNVKIETSTLEQVEKQS